MSTIFSSLEIASSGMSAQRTRMNVAAMNMANKATTRTDEGGPYRRRDVVLSAADVRGGQSFAETLRANLSTDDDAAYGVTVAEIVPSDDQFQLQYDPGHPDADADGYVAYPAVSGVKEMVNMMSAARAYEAGAKMLTTVKTMAEKALTIGK